jgi:membrane-associated protease RseP (regulator of RpoE activity)
MNFILAGLIFGTLFFLGTSPIHVQIREFEPNSLLSRAGSGTQLIPIFDTIEQAESSGVLQRLSGVALNPTAGSIAERKGVQSGDILISVNQEKILRPDDVVRILGTGKASYSLQILRDKNMMNIDIIPLAGKIGVFVTPNVRLITYRYSLGKSLISGISEVYHQIGFSFRTFGAIIGTSFSHTATQAEKKEVKNGIGGPVAIGKVFVGMVQNGVDI